MLFWKISGLGHPFSSCSSQRLPCLIIIPDHQTLHSSGNKTPSSGNLCTHSHSVFLSLSLKFHSQQNFFLTKLLSRERSTLLCLQKMSQVLEVLKKQSTVGTTGTLPPGVCFTGMHWNPATWFPGKPTAVWQRGRSGGTKNSFGNYLHHWKWNTSLKAECSSSWLGSRCTVIYGPALCVLHIIRDSTAEPRAFSIWYLSLLCSIIFLYFVFPVKGWVRIRKGGLWNSCSYHLSRALFPSS